MLVDDLFPPPWVIAPTLELVFRIVLLLNSSAHAKQVKVILVSCEQGRHGIVISELLGRKAVGNGFPCSCDRFDNSPVAPEYGAQALVRLIWVILAPVLNSQQSKGYVVSDPVGRVRYVSSIRLNCELHELIVIAVFRERFLIEYATIERV